MGGVRSGSYFSVKLDMDPYKDASWNWILIMGVSLIWIHIQGPDRFGSMSRCELDLNPNWDMDSQTTVQGHGRLWSDPFAGSYQGADRIWISIVIWIHRPAYSRFLFQMVIENTLRKREGRKVFDEHFFFFTLS